MRLVLPGNQHQNVGSVGTVSDNRSVAIAITFM
jgi:hypothetical protein